MLTRSKDATDHTITSQQLGLLVLIPIGDVQEHKSLSGVFISFVICFGHFICLDGNHGTMYKVSSVGMSEDFNDEGWHALNF